MVHNGRKLLQDIGGRCLATAGLLKDKAKRQMEHPILCGEFIVFTVVITSFLIHVLTCSTLLRKCFNSLLAPTLLLQEL